MDLTAVTTYVGAERSAVGAFGAGDAWLAGGTWLFSEPQPSVTRLHDLTAFGWPPLVVSAAGLEIAATCTLAELHAHRPPDGWSAAPLIAECCEALLGSFKVWNTATVGGNLCLALPAAPMAALAVALEGTCVVWTGDGERRMDALDLVTGPRATALAPGELLRAITLPAAALGSRTAFRQASLTTLGRSAAVVVGRAGEDGLTITLTASVPRPVRLRFPQAPSAAVLAEALDAAVDGWYDDVHGDPVWRAHRTRALAEEVRAELAAAD